MAVAEPEIVARPSLFAAFNGRDGGCLLRGRWPLMNGLI